MTSILGEGPFSKDSWKKSKPSRILRDLISRVCDEVVWKIYFRGMVHYFMNDDWSRKATEKVGSDSGGERCSIFYLELTGGAVLIKEKQR